MHVIIAGGSGYVGGYLAHNLVEQHNQVTILTHSDINQVAARLDKHHKLSGKVDIINYHDYNGEGDVLVNLAGESLGAKAISKRRLKVLLSSRIEVLDALSTQMVLPPVFIQASAVAYYNEDCNEEVDETSTDMGKSQIAQIAIKLEERANQLNEQFHFKRFYIARLGIVLSRNGGFIKKAAMTPPFTVIHGYNKVPFIELNDAINALQFLCEKDVPSGPVNLTSPKSATLQELLHCCYKHSKLPQIPIITGFLRLGDRRIQLLTTNQNVVPKVLLNMGFVFHTPNIQNVQQPYLLAIL